jgi:hypothetical protein
MEYVNTIAHIVHTAVILHGGAANKNIGDAFLLVWKMPKGLRLRDIAAMSNAGGAGGGRGGRGVKHSVSGREGRTQRRSSGNAQVDVGSISLPSNGFHPQHSCCASCGQKEHKGRSALYCVMC